MILNIAILQESQFCIKSYSKWKEIKISHHFFFNEIVRILILAYKPFARKAVVFTFWVVPGVVRVQLGGIIRKTEHMNLVPQYNYKPENEGIEIRTYQKSENILQNLTSKWNKNNKSTQSIVQGWKLMGNVR